MQEVEITEFETWEDFELIAKVLRTNLNCQFLHKTDGPDARSWQFRFGNIIFWLVHDDMIGNFINTEDENSIDEVNQLIKNLKFIFHSNFEDSIN